MWLCTISSHQKKWENPNTCYWLFLSIVLRGRILGWALLGKSVISTFQLFYKANRQHHPLNQSFQSHPKMFIYLLGWDFRSAGFYLVKFVGF